MQKTAKGTKKFTEEEKLSIIEKAKRNGVKGTYKTTTQTTTGALIK